MNQKNTLNIILATAVSITKSVNNIKIADII
jgi:hypothetical protein